MHQSKCCFRVPHLEASLGFIVVHPKVMDVLCALADHPGEVISRDVLMDRVWGDYSATEESLFRAISLLRKIFRTVEGGAAYRRDPRFWAEARRFGLVDYWLDIDQWPDFCSEDDLPFDCRERALHIRNAGNPEETAVTAGPPLTVRPAGTHDGGARARPR